MAGWRSELAGCRSTLSMSNIKVRISETKYCYFYKTLVHALVPYAFLFPINSFSILNVVYIWKWSSFSGWGLRIHRYSDSILLGHHHNDNCWVNISTKTITNFHFLWGKAQFRMCGRLASANDKGMLNLNNYYLSDWRLQLNPH